MENQDSNSHLDLFTLFDRVLERILDTLKDYPGGQVICRPPKTCCILNQVEKHCEKSIETLLY